MAEVSFISNSKRVCLGKYHNGNEFVCVVCGLKNCECGNLKEQSEKK